MADTLLMMMRKAINEGTIKGIKLNRYCPSLSHLLIADDSIFFLDGKLVECQNLAMILNQCCYALGQEINLYKSGIFMGPNYPLQLKNSLAKALKVPVMGKTGKYLGIPSDWGIQKNRCSRGLALE